MTEIKLKDYLEDAEDEIEISQWFVKAGDEFAADKAILEVLINKAETEIVIGKAGKVVELKAQEGEIVSPEDVVCVIE